MGLVERGGLALAAVLAALPVAGLGPATDHAVAAVTSQDADIDGDGRADLVIGAPGEAHGAVYVLYGDGGRQRIGGEQVDPAVVAMGFATATCDANGDGFADVVAGDPRAISRRVRAGAVVVLYGGGDGLSPTRSTVVAQGTSFGEAPGVAAGNDEFGFAVGCGRIDRDRYADVVVGAPGDRHGPTDPGPIGSVTMLAGSSRGLVVDQDWYWRDSTFSPLVAVRARFGHAVAVGDVTGDGLGDTIVGEPFSEDLRGIAIGAIYVIRGRPRGWPSILKRLETIDGEQARAYQFGATLVISRFDPGPADVAVGSYNGTYGAVTLLGGSSEGLRPLRTIYRDTDGLPRPVWRPDTYFGAALAAGDVDDDSHMDLLVGSPGEQAGASTGAGAVVLLKGTARGPTTAGSQRFTANTPGVAGRAGRDEQFGYSVALGDRSGDGRAEAIVATAFDTVRRRDDAGSAVLLRGTRRGLSATTVPLLHAGTMKGRVAIDGGFGASAAG
jgi:FG-GAP repeat protein